MNEYAARARATWSRLSQNQRLAVLAVIVTAVIAGTLLMMSRPPQRFQTAFSGLSSEDAAAIVDQLRSEGIAYELSSDGSTIRVPSSHVAEVRLNAASNGLPKGGSTGFELFDKSSFGITDFAQRVNYQRAIEGELQRTINKIDAVAASRVHIVIPEQSLFTDEQEPTTAAVVLQLRPNSQLTDRQIKGVTHLVSGSVPGLKPENLTVVDTGGNPIWAGTADDAAAGLDEHFRLQKAYEADVERQLQTLVNRVVGAQHAAVSVSAALNWDERTIESETFSPDGNQPQVRSQQERTATSSSGSASNAEGAPGTDSNVQTFQQGAPEGENASSGQSSSRDVTTNYELSRRVEQVNQAPGRLERLSVAVVLDDQQVNPAVAQEIENVVTAAAGLIPARGDTITVSAVPFSALDGTGPLTPEQGPGLFDRVLSGLKIAGLIAVPLVAIFFARRHLLQPARGRRSLAAYTTPPPHAPATQRIRVRETPPQSVPATQHENPVVAQQRLKELAISDPAQVAQVVRYWMNEEQ